MPISSTKSGEFVVGKSYIITSLGVPGNLTNFELIGAITNSVGLEFVATGSGSGTGTADYNSDSTMLLQSIGNSIINVGDTLYYYDTFVSGRLPIPITGSTYPNVNKYSGSLLFIDNKKAFQPTKEQTVSIKTAIRL